MAQYEKTFFVCQRRRKQEALFFSSLMGKGRKKRVGKSKDFSWGITVQRKSFGFAPKMCWRKHFIISFSSLSMKFATSGENCRLGWASKKLWSQITPPPPPVFLRFWNLTLLRQTHNTNCVRGEVFFLKRADNNTAKTVQFLFSWKVRNSTRRSCASITFKVFFWQTFFGRDNSSFSFRLTEQGETFVIRSRQNKKVLFLYFLSTLAGSIFGKTRKSSK